MAVATSFEEKQRSVLAFDNVLEAGLGPFIGKILGLGPLPALQGRIFDATPRIGVQNRGSSEAAHLIRTNCLENLPFV